MSEDNQYLGLHREKNCGCPNCYQPVSDDATLPSLGIFNNDLVKAMSKYAALLEVQLLQAQADLVQAEAEFYRYHEEEVG